MRPVRTCSALLASALLASAPLQAQSPDSVMGAPYHDAARAFIDLMIPHHESARMMAEHATRAARTDAVRELARTMIETQTKEIAELKAARRALFGSDSSRSPMMRAMMQMMGMQRMRDSSASRAMMDTMRMQRPGAAQGGEPGRRAMAGGMPDDFDRMFLHHMISHHQDGAEMSLLVEHTQAPERVKALAKKIRDGQERDIVEMRRILSSMPGAMPPGHGH